MPDLLEMLNTAHTLSPREIVIELDKHIVGQPAAKRAVAIALRNRWRRMQLEPTLRMEVTPKNILMIGPTGVGKTEIARRVAKLVDAPFIKVEATKFTEVGYVGRDVESIIRDLADIAVKQMREREMLRVRDHAEVLAEDRILDALLPPARTGLSGFVDEPHFPNEKESSNKAARDAFRKKLRSGELDDREIEIEVQATPVGVEIMAPPGMEEMTNQLQSMFQNLSSERKRPKKMRIKAARKQIQDEEAAKLVDDEQVKIQALKNVEEQGIVFIDEIDKVARRAEYSGGADVSREGVQRDLLPLVEGSTVSTKYGPVKTDHILFIASGAFHVAKPSDLIPELQGRLPIRVELSALTVEDFTRILIEPDASLTKQYMALLATENVSIQFTEEGISRMAEIAWHVNESTENIGARRLHTIIERLLEELAFDGPEKAGNTVIIDKKYVNDHLEKLAENEDLSRYIL